METDIAEDHPIRQLARENRDTVEMLRVPDSIVETYEFNFMLIDDIGYRFESDREECKAFVALHDDGELFSFGRIFDQLEQIFAQLKNTSTPLPA